MMLRAWKRGLTTAAEGIGAVPYVLVFGGNGFVGSSVCRAALASGVGVVSVNRSGRPRTQAEWAEKVRWVEGSALDPSTYEAVLEGALGAVSCVGTFGSNSKMYEVCGTANIRAIEACRQASVPRFAFLSAHNFGFPKPILAGYVEGKRAAEQALFAQYGSDGLALRPGMIYGPRRVDTLGITLPLGIIGAPLETLLAIPPLQGISQTLMHVPIVGAPFVPPVSVDSVGQAAVSFVLGEDVPSREGVMDAWQIREMDKR